jgi:hypothetical protein
MQVFSLLLCWFVDFSSLLCVSVLEMFVCFFFGSAAPCLAAAIVVTLGKGFRDDVEQGATLQQKQTFQRLPPNEPKKNRQTKQKKNVQC